MTTSYSDIVKKIKEAVFEAAATTNHPEAKLRERVAPLWDGYLRSKRIDLNFQVRDERQLANGRADTVFNRLVLEYKKPGVIKPDNAKNRQLIAQVRGYIEDLAKEQREKEKRLLGVAFDGNYFLFIRPAKGGGRWIAEDPTPVSVESVERFLLTLEKLTTKAALVPDNLIRDFAVGAGSLNYIASNAIKAFYFALTKSAKGGIDERVKVFFEQWALQFAEVHGAIENKKFDAETLFKSYGFKKDELKNFDFLAFFFALDTYYGLLMKLLAYQVVGFYTLKNIAGLPLADWEKLDSAVLKEKLTELEEGGIFRSLGIRNFLEGDLLSWYLNVSASGAIPHSPSRQSRDETSTKSGWNWNDPIDKAIRGIIERLNQYDPETMELVPDETRDILKKLYQFLVPKQIRHDLGEYYTPDWLAERCLNQVGYGVKERDLLQKRVLDPGCGSGTFLILAIKRAKEHARLKEIDPAETLTQITKNIVGFDLNPLAVISARTNYLLAVADLLKHKKGEITIPIYLCDSINPPSAKRQDELFDQEAGHYQISTSVGLFRFPEALVEKAAVQKVTTLLEDGVKKKQTPKQFLERVHAELKDTTPSVILNGAKRSEESERKRDSSVVPPTAGLPQNDKRELFDLVLGETYEKLVELEQKGINGVWARIIKNAFAPLFVGQFDLIVGNPPWVNWESLPQEYRDKTAHIWQQYNLFEHTGLKARLGSSKDDISVLMTYVAIDKYLINKGKLCFVITQSLFKTVGGGEGFRRFRLGESETPFKVFQVDDMVQLQPFDAAANRTAVFVCQKGFETEYPVEYDIWHKKNRGSIGIDLSWSEIVEKTYVRRLKAESIDGSQQGPWITARGKALGSVKKASGKSEYKAREGANNFGLSGTYWVKIKSKEKNGILKIENLFNDGKIKVEPVEAHVESLIVYPLLRWSDMRKWVYELKDAILVPHEPENFAKPIPLKRLPALSLKYFQHFEKQLSNRPMYKKFLLPQAYPFYAIYGVGPYTLSKFKLCWQTMGEKLRAVVLSESDMGGLLMKCKPIIPQHTVAFIPLEDLDEAHYTCAVMNSSISDFIARSYSMGKSFGNPHILGSLHK